MVYLYTEQDTVELGDKFELKLECTGLAQEDIERIEWDTLEKIQFINAKDTSFVDLDIDISNGLFKGDDYIFERNEMEWIIDDQTSPPSFSNSFTVQFWEYCAIAFPGPTIFFKNGQSFQVPPKNIYVRNPMIEGLKDLAPSLDIVRSKQTIWDVLLDFWWLIALLLLLILAYIFREKILALGKKKPELEQAIEVKEEPKIPAHVIALDRLNSLKKEQRWKQEDDKRFVSELTDIIREYIEGRFGVLAQEMTTQEIIDALDHQILTAIQHEQLGNTLNVADMIKFAKAKADATAYEQFVDDAIDLVEGTKQEVAKDGE